MDPLSQAVLGGTAAQLKAKPQQLKQAALLGAISGMAADLDIFIRSNTDPLLALEYHRHFTHSLVFIPIGGVLCAIFFYLVFSKRWQLSFKQSLWWCILGYGTHALLDACTSYGTRLYWPFSDQRLAWDTISIIDPLFTLPLLSLLLLAAYLKRRLYNYIALSWLAIYMTIGFVQHERAIAVGQQIAANRGHNPVKISAKPSFGNIIVWKIIYEENDRFYIDAVKPTLNKPVIWQGDSIKKLQIDTDLPWLDKNSQQAKDLARFTQFSNGYVAIDNRLPNHIVDMRYSMLPHQIEGMWGLKLDKEANTNAHARWTSLRSSRKNAFSDLWKMIIE